MSENKFAVGIDLGTTNCALASAPFKTEDPVPPAIMDIPQVVNPGEVENRPLLPSFCYLPGEHELQAGATALPWDKNRDYATGLFALRQGSRVPDRLVSSAKSWLSVVSSMDKRGAILPWGAPEGVQKVSPVEASTRYLQHLREAWDASHGKGEKLAKQDVVLTVPASFDPGARELTAEAARAAGLENMTLLEEPQAALYAWLAARGESWRRELKAGDVVLVVDVGGGTTDLSLMAVGEENGTLHIHRIAVGDHILLGGDNMDLALAHHVKAKLEAGGKTLDQAQFQALTFACREAKEQLFSRADLATFPIALASRGSKLMGGTMRTELERETLVSVLVEGFFPRAGQDARPVKARRTGLATMGLPYAQDPAVTKHLAEFLAKQLGAAAAQHAKTPQGATFLHPTCVLFNGGVFKAEALQGRVVEVLNTWLKAEGSEPVRVLSGQDLDHAVAKGASYYAHMKARGGVRIRGGTARAYYVGIELNAPAVPGVPPPIKAMCVAPFGMEEGSQTDLPGEMGLVTGEPAQFRFFSSTTRRTDTVGAEVKDIAELTELPPIEATASGTPGELLPVHIRSHVTPIGTLELACMARNGEQRARFEFNVREE
ncbi:MAG: Hsp70 family protein [Myxococcota bacterium]